VSDEVCRGVFPNAKARFFHAAFEPTAGFKVGIGESHSHQSTAWDFTNAPKIDQILLKSMGVNPNG
jgi:hypothetical protein